MKVEVVLANLGRGITTTLCRWWWNLVIPAILVGVGLRCQVMLLISSLSNKDLNEVCASNVEPHTDTHKPGS